MNHPEPCALCLCVVGSSTFRVVSTVSLCSFVLLHQCLSLVVRCAAEGVMPERDSGTTATAPAGAQPLSGPASGGPAAGAAQGEHLLHTCLALLPECSVQTLCTLCTRSRSYNPYGTL